MKLKRKKFRVKMIFRYTDIIEQSKRAMTWEAQAQFGQAAAFFKIAEALKEWEGK